MNVFIYYFTMQATCIINLTLPELTQEDKIHGGWWDLWTGNKPVNKEHFIIK